MKESGTAESGGSSEQILANIIDALRKDEATDIPLLDIISQHVVTLSPAADAIDAAMSDIETLAIQRGKHVD